MAKSLAVWAVLLFASGAHAMCTGTGAFRQCQDGAGNFYNIQQYGNITQMQGSNAQTGSSWSQTTQTYGNTTYHQGTAANGQPWNGTSTSVGGTTFHRGIDSSGNPYSRICNQFGCN